MMNQYTIQSGPDGLCQKQKKLFGNMSKKSQKYLKSIVIFAIMQTKLLMINLEGRMQMSKSYFNKLKYQYFDRHPRNHSVRMSNIFKMGKWHGLLITKQHDPTAISFCDIYDMLNDSLVWAKEIHSIDPQFK